MFDVYEVLKDTCMPLMIVYYIEKNLKHCTSVQDVGYHDIK